MADKLYRVRTANGALLAEYKWHTGLDRLVQRFALRWAGFERDGFVGMPASYAETERLVEQGTLMRAETLLPAKLLALHTTPITASKVSILAVSEVGDVATNYIVQSGEVASFTTDDVFTQTLKPSLFSYDSWRGAKAQVERLLLASTGWVTRDHSEQAAWPDRLLAVIAEEQRQLAARPARALNAEDFAKRMRAMRAKGAGHDT